MPEVERIWLPGEPSRQKRTTNDAKGLTPRGTSPDDPGKSIRVQLTRYGELIKQSGITAE